MRNLHATSRYEQVLQSLAITILLCSACKSSHSDPTAGSTATSAKAPIAHDGIERLSSTDGDGAAAASVATKYMHAMAARDWSAACATRATHEREEMARLVGSCEAAFAAIAANQPVEVFGHLAPTGVRRRGDMIAVDMNQPGQTKPTTTLILKREGTAWLLVDVPDEQNF